MFELKFAVLMVLIGAIVSFAIMMFYFVIEEMREMKREEKRRLYERAERIVKRRLGEL